MSKQKPILELYRGDTLLGFLSNMQLYDWPWYRCTFQPTPAFEQYKPLFDREMALLQDKGANEEWDAAYAEIEALNLTLIHPNRAKTIDILLLHLHIDSKTAEFKAVFH